MIDFGSVPANSVLPITFASYGKTNGESITLSGLAVTDIEIFKGTSMTQRASDNGYTLLDTDGIDIDGITGIHGFSVDLSDNSDASFYSIGSFFTVVVSSVTVDSQTVSFRAATFRIVAAESIAGKPKVDVDAFGGTAGTFSSGRPETNTTHLAGTAYGSADFSATMKASINTEADTALSDYGALKPTTAGRTLDVSAAGNAGIDWGNVENPTTTVGLSGTTVKAVTDRVTANADQLAGQTIIASAGVTFPAIVASQGTLDDVEAGVSSTEGVVASLSTRIPAALTADGLMKSDTLRVGGTLQTGANVGSLVATVGAAGAGLTAITIPLSALPTLAQFLAGGDIDGYTLEQCLKLLLSPLAGKLSGAGTDTETFRAADDSKDRIVATVDASGNRTGIVLDATG